MKVNSTQKFFTCIELSVDDFRDTPEVYKKVCKLNDKEMQDLASEIGEWIFDGDLWNQAIEKCGDEV